MTPAEFICLRMKSVFELHTMNHSYISLLWERSLQAFTIHGVQTFIYTFKIINSHLFI